MRDRRAWLPGSRLPFRYQLCSCDLPTCRSVPRPPVPASRFAHASTSVLIVTGEGTPEEENGPAASARASLGRAGLAVPAPPRTPRDGAATHRGHRSGPRRDQGAGPRSPHRHARPGTALPPTGDIGVARGETRAPGRGPRTATHAPGRRCHPPGTSERPEERPGRRATAEAQRRAVQGTPPSSARPGRAPQNARTLGWAHISRRDFKKDQLMWPCASLGVCTTFSEREKEERVFREKRSSDPYQFAEGHSSGLTV
nr:uncharacterized protein LOC109729266 [Microcebus murinus]